MTHNIYIRKILHNSTVSVGLAQACPNKFNSRKILTVKLLPSGEFGKNLCVIYTLGRYGSVRGTKNAAL